MIKKVNNGNEITAIPPENKNARKDFFPLVYFYKLSESAGFKRQRESVPGKIGEMKDVLAQSQRNQVVGA